MKQVANGAVNRDCSLEGSVLEEYGTHVRARQDLLTESNQSSNKQPFKVLDWELLLQSKAGDESAWQQLTSRHQPLLWKWLLLSTRKRDLAEEIQQETWVRMYHVTPSHHAGSFRAYLFRIARNLLLKTFAKEKREQSLDPDEWESTDSGPLNELLHSDRDRWLTMALASLPAEQRNVLELRFLGDQSLAEIAVVLAVPLGTVKSRLHYGISSCREYLERRGVEL
jgi:RNA polymerase sigma factor (sigma-70 family)